MKALEKYEAVFDTILSKIESWDVKSWIRPWVESGSINLISKKPYRGFNSLIASLAYVGSDFENAWSFAFVTDNQASAIFWKLLWLQKSDDWRLDKNDYFRTIMKRQWSSATPIFFYKRYIKKGCEDLDENDPKKYSSIWTYNNVYPIEFYKLYDSFKDEIDAMIPSNTNNSDNKNINASELANEYMKFEWIDFMEDSGIFGSWAYYSPINDRIVMPLYESFHSDNDYWSTLFHEIIHSTWIEKRLWREIENRFWDRDYSFEELVAETWSLMLSSETWIITDDIVDNSAAYIHSWMKRLASDKDASKITFYKAISASKNAKDYVLWSQEVEETENEEINN